jgi:hypothetical protein
VQNHWSLNVLWAGSILHASAYFQLTEAVFTTGNSGINVIDINVDLKMVKYENCIMVNIDGLIV